MGGKLLSNWNLPEKRVSRADFDRIMEEVLFKLRKRFVLRRIEPLRFFSEKADFGDLDVAMENFVGQSVFVNVAEVLKELFGYEVHKNGNCYSFPVEGFQVDVLLFDSDVFESALVYYAFESGNFMGRVADQMGYSYGHRGLYLQVPLSYFKDGYPDHEYREFLLARDPRMIFSYLGFDYARFEKGFKNFDEMAQWVADSYYFQPDVFAFDALNSVNRTRNKKRPVYAKFVEWCQQQRGRNFIPDKKVLRDELIQNNADLREQVEEVRMELVRNEERRAKFNGNLVKEWLGLEGDALGKFIVAFKKRVDDFNLYLDAHSTEQVKNDVYALKKLLD